MFLYRLSHAERMALVREAQLPSASIDQLLLGRHILASRADMLLGRNRRRYVPSREAEGRALQASYDATMRRLLAARWS